jgi:hypothetical protein
MVQQSCKPTNTLSPNHSTDCRSLPPADAHACSLCLPNSSPQGGGSTIESKSTAIGRHPAISTSNAPGSSRLGGNTVLLCSPHPAVAPQVAAAPAVAPQVAVAPGCGPAGGGCTRLWPRRWRLHPAVAPQVAVARSAVIIYDTWPCVQQHTMTLGLACVTQQHILTERTTRPNILHLTPSTHSGLMIHTCAPQDLPPGTIEKDLATMPTRHHDHLPDRVRDDPQNYTL